MSAWIMAASIKRSGRYRIVSDPILLCEIVYAVCKPDADAAGISDAQFAAAMAGDSIENATKALLEDIVNFPPNPRDRARLTRVLSKTWAAVDKAQDMMDQRLTDAVIDATLAKALTGIGGSFGSLPGSSASTSTPRATSMPT